MKGSVAVSTNHACTYGSHAKDLEAIRNPGNCGDVDGLLVWFSLSHDYRYPHKAGERLSVNNFDSCYVISRFYESKATLLRPG